MFTVNIHLWSWFPVWVTLLLLLLVCFHLTSLARTNCQQHHKMLSSPTSRIVAGFDPGATRKFSDMCQNHPSAIFFLKVHTILHDIWVFDTIITRYLRYFMTHDWCKICPKKSAKCVICMSNIHNGTRRIHQMHKSGKIYANSC